METAVFSVYSVQFTVNSGMVYCELFTGIRPFLNVQMNNDYYTYVCESGIFDCHEMGVMKSIRLEIGDVINLQSPISFNSQR